MVNFEMSNYDRLWWYLKKTAHSCSCITFVDTNGMEMAFLDTVMKTCRNV